MLLLIFLDASILDTIYRLTTVTDEDLSALHRLHPPPMSLFSVLPLATSVISYPPDLHFAKENLHLVKLGYQYCYPSLHLTSPTSAS